ncbi:MAG: aquaporin [Clostridia bacterium]|nr:aquaporin [Clostridia bacterium]
MYKKMIAEFVGTFLLVFMGTGAILVSKLTNAFGHLGIAVVFGIVVMVLIYSFGHISGAHFNPAVSIAFLVNKDLRFHEMICYCAVQVTGAISASFVLFGMFGNGRNLGVTQPSEGWAQSFVLELILTFILMSVILMSAVHGKASKPFAGIAIGSTVAIEALVFGPICGASMNPARSIGPAIVSGNPQYLWLYIIATILGAVLSVLLYRYVFHENEKATVTGEVVNELN